MSEQENKFHFQITPEERISSIENTLKEVLKAIRSIRPHNDLPNMLTSEQAMEVLKIGRWKYDQLIAEGDLKHIRKGRKIYVYESSIKEYFGIN